MHQDIKNSLANEIDLSGCNVDIVSDKEFQRPFAFALSTREADRAAPVRYVFVAQDGRDRTAWMETILTCSRYVIPAVAPSASTAALAVEITSDTVALSSSPANTSVNSEVGSIASTTPNVTLDFTTLTAVTNDSSAPRVSDLVSNSAPVAVGTRDDQTSSSVTHSSFSLVGSNSGESSTKLNAVHVDAAASAATLYSSAGNSVTPPPQPVDPMELMISNSFRAATADLTHKTAPLVVSSASQSIRALQSSFATASRPIIGADVNANAAQVATGRAIPTDLLTMFEPQTTNLLNTHGVSAAVVNDDNDDFGDFEQSSNPSAAVSITNPQTFAHVQNSLQSFGGDPTTAHASVFNHHIAAPSQVVSLSVAGDDDDFADFSSAPASVPFVDVTTCAHSLSATYPLPTQVASKSSILNDALGQLGLLDAVPSSDLPPSADESDEFADFEGAPSASPAHTGMESKLAPHDSAGLPSTQSVINTQDERVDEFGDFSSINEAVGSFANVANDTPETTSATYHAPVEAVSTSADPFASFGSIVSSLSSSASLDLASLVPLTQTSKTSLVHVESESHLDNDTHAVTKSSEGVQEGVAIAPPAATTARARLAPDLSLLDAMFGAIDSESAPLPSLTAVQSSESVLTEVVAPTLHSERTLATVSNNQHILIWLRMLRFVERLLSTLMTSSSPFLEAISNMNSLPAQARISSVEAYLNGTYSFKSPHAPSKLLSDFCDSCTQISTNWFV